MSSQENFFGVASDRSLALSLRWPGRDELHRVVLGERYRVRKFGSMPAGGMASDEGGMTDGLLTPPRPRSTSVTPRRRVRVRVRERLMIAPRTPDTRAARASPRPDRALLSPARSARAARSSPAGRIQAGARSRVMESTSMRTGAPRQREEAPAVNDDHDMTAAFGAPPANHEGEGRMPASRSRECRPRRRRGRKIELVPARAASSVWCPSSPCRRARREGSKTMP